MIVPPFEHNIYTNPHYYYDASTSADKTTQEWLDTQIQLNGTPIDPLKITLQFQIDHNVFYSIYLGKEIKTYRDLVYATYDFYMKEAIDMEFTEAHELPINCGYWYFYLDIIGCYLAGFEIKNNNTIQICARPQKTKPTKTVEKIVPSYLCKKCYHLHISERTHCNRCKTALTPENRIHY